jgi:hypothetical protein
MSQADLDEILKACRSVPVMMVGGYAPSSLQENANRAWARLGEKMGFDSETVRPIDGKGNRFFTAVPSETEAARQERLTRESEEKRQQEIARLTDEIAERQRQLGALKAARVSREGDE